MGDELREVTNVEAECWLPNSSHHATSATFQPFVSFDITQQTSCLILPVIMEKAFAEAVEKAVTAAVDKAIPASVNHAFVTAVDQAVKEKMKELEPAIEKRVTKEIESAIEKKIKRAIRKAELEEKLEQSWNRWLENKNVEDEINQVRWRSELDELKKEEEKIKETAQQG
ncbi:hypothetical protein KCU95_g11986, partial [Aureobasidium melanogenum]